MENIFKRSFIRIGITFIIWSIRHDWYFFEIARKWRRYDDEKETNHDLNLWKVYYALRRILSFLSEVKKFCKNGEISPASLIQPEISCLVPRWILNFLPRQKHASACKNCIVENVDNKSRTPPPIQRISPSIANSIHSSMSSRDRFSVFLSLKKEKKNERRRRGINKKKKEKKREISIQATDAFPYQVLAL